MSSSSNRDFKSLTDDEKNLIRKSWNLLAEDMEPIAVDIFEAIFDRLPESKEVCLQIADFESSAKILIFYISTRPFDI